MRLILNASKNKPKMLLKRYRQKTVHAHTRYFKKGRGNNLCLCRNQQPQLLPHPPQSRSSTMIIQQESPFPQPQLLLPHPLFPHRHIRQMIQRMQLQEPFPKRLFPLPHPQVLLHPHRSSPHPQFVAAKSLIVNPPDFVYSSYYAKKPLCVTT